MLRIVIIDDEQNARELIAKTITQNCKNVQITGYAENVKSGLAVIKEHKPDLVLLDINMPDGTGFDLLQRLPEINFKIIFITAYQEYAVQAFKFSALDYILKPVDATELAAAISKAEETLQQKNIETHLNTYKENAANPAKEFKKLV